MIYHIITRPPVVELSYYVTSHYIPIVPTVIQSELFFWCRSAKTRRHSRAPTRNFILMDNQYDLYRHAAIPSRLGVIVMVESSAAQHSRLVCIFLRFFFFCTCATSFRLAHQFRRYATPLHAVLAVFAVVLLPRTYLFYRCHSYLSSRGPRYMRQYPFISRHRQVYAFAVTHGTHDTSYRIIIIIQYHKAGMLAKCLQVPCVCE